MSSTSDPMFRPTNVLVEAGEILRALKPSILGTLLVVYTNDNLTQDEIGNAIGCARSTVSKYLQSLEGLGLARKGSQRYEVTDVGERVIGLIARTVGEHETDLYSVNWSDEDEKESIATYLAPLSDSRRISSFFILNSLYKRSGTLGCLGGSEAVPLEDVVQDVEARQADRSESTTTEQVRQKLRRFEDAGVIEFDGRKIRLIDKGQEHGRVLEQLIDILMDQKDVDDREVVGEDRASSISNNSEESHIPQTDSSVEMYGRTATDKTTSQNKLHKSLISTSSVAGSQDVHDLPTITPAYYLRSDIRNIEERSQSQQSPVLPLTSLTIGELADYINRLIDEYSEDAQIDPYWTVQTESGYTPVYPVIPQQDLHVTESNNS